VAQADELLAYWPAEQMIVQELDPALDVFPEGHDEQLDE